MEKKESHQEGGGKLQPVDVLGQLPNLPCQVSKGQSVTDKGLVIRPLASTKCIRSGWDGSTKRAKGP